ncbi:MAG: hypothetical protein PHD32_11535 [Eubacteriales bacterium]|nr:hypothetical protein [Eubacteriales bacterium]
MKLRHKLACALTWACVAAPVLGYYGMWRGWTAAQCLWMLAAFALSALLGMGVSLFLGKKSGALQLLLAVVLGALPGILWPGVGLSTAGRVACALGGAGLAVAVNSRCNRPLEKAFTLPALSVQMLFFLVGYTATWMQGESAKNPLVSRWLVFTSLCGVVWIVLSILLLGEQAVRRSARAEAGKAPSPAFARRNAIFIAVYLVLVLVLGFFSVLGNGLTQALRGVFNAITLFFARLFPDRVGEWTVPEVTATAAPVGMILDNSDGTVGNILFYIFAYGNLIFWTFMLIRMLIRRMPGWMQRLRGMLGHFFKSWRAQADDFEDSSESLFTWAAVRAGAADAMRRAAKRLKPAKRLSECADNTERVRLLYGRHLRRLKKAGLLDPAQTPLERDGGGDDGELARVYGDARYGEKIPGEETMRALEARRERG